MSIRDDTCPDESNLLRVAIAVVSRLFHRDGTTLKAERVTFRTTNSCGTSLSTGTRRYSFPTCKEDIRSPMED